MFAYVIFTGLLAIALNLCVMLASRRLLAGHAREASAHA
jgi:hypothetical protein